MNHLEPILVAACWTLIVLGTLAVFGMALFGKDLEVFERLRQTAPRQFNNMKKSCRISGPLVAVMAAIFLVAIPFWTLAGEIGLLQAAGCFAFSAIYLWLSIHWFRWAGRA